MPRRKPLNVRVIYQQNRRQLLRITDEADQSARFNMGTDSFRIEQRSAPGGQPCICRMILLFPRRWNDHTINRSNESQLLGFIATLVEPALTIGQRCPSRRQLIVCFVIDAATL